MYVQFSQFNSYMEYVILLMKNNNKNKKKMPGEINRLRQGYTEIWPWINMAFFHFTTNSSSYCFYQSLKLFVEILVVNIVKFYVSDSRITHT